MTGARASEDAESAGAASVGPRMRVQHSKLTPPQARKGIAPRGQLLDRLREGRERKLTLVCAPAGYGKTTLLAQWCEADRDRIPFVWVSADEGDSVLATGRSVSEVARGLDDGEDAPPHDLPQARGPNRQEAIARAGDIGLT